MSSYDQSFITEKVPSEPIWDQLDGWANPEGSDTVLCFCTGETESTLSEYTLLKGRIFLISKPVCCIFYSPMWLPGLEKDHWSRCLLYNISCDVRKRGHWQCWYQLKSCFMGPLFSVYFTFRCVTNAVHVHVPLNTPKSLVLVRDADLLQSLPLWHISFFDQH